MKKSSRVLKAWVRFYYQDCTVLVVRSGRYRRYHYTFDSMLRLFRLSDRCVMASARNGIFLWMVNQRRHIPKIKPVRFSVVVQPNSNQE